jgi:p-hydroxybenzoate 3-monooxygenase
VKRLGTALVAKYADGSDELLDRYSDDALERVWQSTYFSWWMTSMLHTPARDDPDRDFLLQMQMTQLRHVTTSKAAATGLAENYTGSVLPYP